MVVVVVNLVWVAIAIAIGLLVSKGNAMMRRMCKDGIYLQISVRYEYRIVMLDTLRDITYGLPSLSSTTPLGRSVLETSSSLVGSAAGGMAVQCF